MRLLSDVKSVNRIRNKTPEEIKKIGESGAISGEIFRALSKMKMEGRSTYDIDGFIDDYIRKRGGKPAFRTVRGYPYSSSISVNEEVVHGIPSRKKIIRKGDLVKIDIGVAYKGYFSDSCVTYIAGGGDQDVDRFVSAAKGLLTAAIGALDPGKSFNDICVRISGFISGTGYSLVRELSGHATGFALHEYPPVPHFGSVTPAHRISEGMVLAIEPVINMGGPGIRISENGWTAVTADGSLSAQFEHTVAVTSNGPVILTMEN